MTTSQTGFGKLWILIGLMLVVTLGLAGLNVYLLLDDDTEEVAQEEEPAVKTAEKPIFVTIEPFTVNLQSDVYGQRMLYTGLSLRVRTEDARELLLEYMPEVRSRLLTLLSGQNAEALISPDGKGRLATDIREELQRPFTEPQPELVIEDVFFTEFIVQ